MAESRSQEASIATPVAQERDLDALLFHAVEVDRDRDLGLAAD
jgi:hypothetical protein